MKRNITFFFLLLIAFSFTFELWSKREAFLSRYDPNLWQVRYEESNWAKGWESKEGLGDAELYAYAGYRQSQGDDPTKINPEMPPLGKYFLGLSIKLFGNQNLPAPFFGILLVWLTYLISREVFRDSNFRFLPVLFLSFDNLFKENLSLSMLDMPFAVFTALTFYSLFLARKNPKYYILTAIGLASVSATKMYLVGFALTAVISLYLSLVFLFLRRRDVFWFVLYLPLFLLFYFGFYLVYFLNNHNLWDFKYFHFWIRHFARVEVANYQRFEILRILIFGNWQTWWGASQIVKVNAWNPFWALGALSNLPALFWLFKEKNLDLALLLIWIFSFLGMYSFGVPYPRYLLPVLPALYIILAYCLKRVSAKLWLNTKR